MIRSHRLPVVLSTGALLSASLLAIAADTPMPSVALTTAESTDATTAAAYPGVLGVVTVGDVDGDGRLDLASVGRVFRNTGGGTFSLLQDGPAPLFIVPDLDGDGRADYVGSDGEGTWAYTSQSDGTVGPQISGFFDSLTTVNAAPVVVDYDHDGINDLIVSVYDGATTRLYFAKGSSSFPFSFDSGYSYSLASNSEFAFTGDQAIPAVAAHFFGSGVDDLAYVTASKTYAGTNPTFSVKVTNGQSSFTPTITGLTPGERVVRLTAGDLDGDGYDEIALVLSSSATDLTAARTAILWSNVAAEGSPQWFPIDNSALSIVPDVSGDGRAELAGRLAGVDGLFLGSTTILDGGGKSLQAYAAATATPVPNRVFSETLVAASGAAFTAQAVPLLAPQTGQDAAANQLLLTDYVTTGTAVHPRLVAPLQPAYTGLAAGNFSVVAPEPRLPLIPAGGQAVFGDPSLSFFQQIDVTIVNAQNGDELGASTSGVYVALSGGVAGTDPQTGLPTLTYSFKTNADLPGYNQALANLAFNTTALAATGQRQVYATVVGRYSLADPVDSYGSRVLLATIDTDYYLMGVAKAGGTATYDVTSAYSPADSFVITRQPAHGVATVDAKGIVTYVANSTAGAGYDPFQVSFTYHPQVSGPRGIDTTLNLVVQNITEPLALTAPGSLQVGTTTAVRAYNGRQPYQIAVTNATWRVSAPVGVDAGVDVDSSESADPFQTIYISPTGSGKVDIVVTDADGARVSSSASSTTPTATSSPAPVIHISGNRETVFAAVCPGTYAGLLGLRAALSGRPAAQVRAFAWDSARQTYVELPAEPTGGLSPNDAVFIATRVDLGLDFSGAATPFGSPILLHPGWNFVGIGPVDDGAGGILRSHPLSLFSVRDETGAQLDALGAAYLWSGTSYGAVTTLQSGTGYWINNTYTDATTGLPIDVTIARVATDPFPTGAARAAGSSTPPAPPSTGAAASSDDSAGGCGGGSGLALVLAGLFAVLRFARPRRR